jgi:acyl-CoA thioesterase I
VLIHLIKKTSRVSVVLLFLVVAPAFSAPKILIFGDSLSTGYGIEKSQSWVSLLEAKIKKHNLSAQVINASISGETTIGGANKIQQVLQLHHPDIIIIALGGNDGLRGLNLNEMQANLETIIKAAKKTGSEVMLIGMKIPPNYGMQYTQQFHATYQNLSQQYQTQLVPFLLEGVGGNPALMQEDGLHPNATAQPKILDNVWVTLSPLLQNRQ